MTYPWDEFSKSLAEDCLPRRQSLRLLGAALVGAVFSPLGTAWGATDPCKAFCRCRNKEQQNACLAACRACGGDTRHLCGSCQSGYVCTDLSSDLYNCGACNHVCEEPGLYEQVACLGGECVYACVEGAVSCFGVCTSLDWDPDNCGTCGNICPESAPYCDQGMCVANECVFPYIPCGGVCVDPSSDRDNCGGCGVRCADDEACIFGFCESGGGW